ncbi:MAG TPA: alpha/beta hydrolase family protein [Bryobacteraceae bacterium]|nr:alpha/beta hydrolase family protein [Bryobacteraceae bacterium]
MNRFYRRWMEDWEHRLCFRTNNRVVRPFEWGLDWTGAWPEEVAPERNGHTPEEYLRDLNERVVANSDAFFSYEPPSDFRLEGDMLRFPSAVQTPYPENNLVHGQWHPAEKHKGRAVVVLPHWNASFGQHGGLCRAIKMTGVSALRISLPYHDFRMPAELNRADYAVSSNIARTIDATRQAVIDVRSCFDWLESQGYTRLGIVGTSLGSCYSFLASAHDPRIRVNVFNHCSSYFADVVWTGLSTQHIRQGIEAEIDIDRLRSVWNSISPAHYLDHFGRWPKKNKFIYASFDTTFLPQYSRDVIGEIQKKGIDNEVVVLPCGHYTLGESPYKFLDGYHICSFLRKWL